MKYDATFERCRDGQGFVKCMSERADGGLYVLKRVDSCVVSCVRDERESHQVSKLMFQIDHLLDRVDGE